MKELEAGYEFTKAQIAELESLRKENAELLEQNAQLEADAAHLGPFYERQLSTLQSKYDALLVVIEAKDVALNFANNEIFATPNRYLEAARYFQIRQALCDGIKTTPSTELLEARDRKRDAKLLRACVDSECCPKDFKNIMQAIANQRESGEWIPELGD